MLTGVAFSPFPRSVTGLASWYMGALNYKTTFCLSFCPSIIIKTNGFREDRCHNASNVH